MSRGERNYLLGSIAVSLLCAVAAHYLAVHYGVAGRYIGPTVAVLVFLAGFVLEPVRDAAHTLLRDFPVSRCNLLLFGPPGNGKTQVFRALQGLPFRGGDDPTIDFDTKSFYMRAGPSNTEFKVTIADYAGQEPYTILSDIAPKSFFGGQYSRKIDAVFFVADLFPLQRNISNDVIKDEALVANIAGRLTVITERVGENMEYFNPWLLQMLFSKVWSQRHRPYAGRLFINKVDLLRDAVKTGGLRLPNDLGAEEYALESYSGLKDLLKKNCDEVGIPSFLSVPISAKDDGDKIRDILKEILERLSERNGP